MRTFAISANSCSSIDETIEKILPGVHEAGNPYFDFIFGSRELALTGLSRWMRRKSSEISVDRVILLQNDQGPVAGFIPLTGVELKATRCVDAAALGMLGSRERRATTLKRLELTRELFLPVDDRDFYLSKFWVDPQHRGAGYARELMSAYFAAGHEAGCTRFRLDVSGENERAIRIYRSFGFREIADYSVPNASLRYVAMLADRPAQ